MAINTDRNVKNESRGKGFADAPRANTTAEGGSDLVLAATAQVQQQALEQQNGILAADISIEHASDMLSDQWAYRMGGQKLLEATLAKTFAKLEQSGTISYDTTVPEIKLDLPPIGNFSSTRQRFLSAFGGDTQKKKSQLPAAFLKQSEGDNGEQCD